MRGHFYAALTAPVSAVGFVVSEAVDYASFSGSRARSRFSQLMTRWLARFKLRNVENGAHYQRPRNLVNYTLPAAARRRGAMRFT